MLFAAQHIHAHSLDAILAPTLVYAYGLTNDLMVSARLPIVIRKDIREGHHSHGPAGNTVDERGDSEEGGTRSPRRAARTGSSATTSRGSSPSGMTSSSSAGLISRTRPITYSTRVLPRSQRHRGPCPG